MTFLVQNFSRKQKFYLSIMWYVRFVWQDSVKTIWRRTPTKSFSYQPEYFDFKVMTIVTVFRDVVFYHLIPILLQKNCLQSHVHCRAENTQHQLRQSANLKRVFWMAKRPRGKDILQTVSRACHETAMMVPMTSLWHHRYDEFGFLSCNSDTRKPRPSARMRFHSSRIFS